MRHFFAILSVCFLTALCLSRAEDAYAQKDSSGVAAVVREAFALRAFDDIELPQGSVRAVHVCRRGYLWVGTREGLVQYKAGQQRVWQQSANADTGLPSAMINTIFEDPQGNVWIGTARGIAVMSASGSEFSIVTNSLPESSQQRDVIAFAAVNTQLIAVTSAGELLRVRPDNAQTLLQRDTLNDLSFPRPGEQSFTSASATSNELYVGTSSEGIYRLRIDNHFFDVLEQIPADSAVIELSVTDDNLIWLDRSAGMLTQPIGGGLAQRHQINPLVENTQGYFRAMDAQSERSAWFAAGASVVRIRGDKADVVRLPGKGNEVRSITVDRAGNIWIGTYYGLYFALDTQFNTLQSADAYQSGVLTTMASVGNRLYLGGQNLWVGDLDSDRFEEITSAAGMPPITGYRLDPRGGGNKPITALAASEKLLLAGYYNGGLDVIDLTNGQVTKVTEVTPGGDSFENSGVTAFAQVDEHTWLATLYMFGLIEISIDTGTGATAPKTRIRRLSEHDMIAGVYSVDENRYLAVTETDLLIFDRDPEGNYALRYFDKGPGGIVFALEPDGLGGAYLGIENVGVRHLPRQQLETATFEPKTVPVVEEHLARRTVWHLLLDSEDTLWATTNNGIYSFDLPRQELISHTTYRDGLPSKEFEYGPNASLLAANGDKLFVSATGPVSFKSPVQPRESRIRLNWTNVTVNGKSLMNELRESESPLSEINLPFSAVSDGVLALEYGYNDHIRALDATYVLRLSKNGEWLPGGRPGVTLTGQQEWGPIDIEFAMLDSSGAVISEAKSVTIDVAPPWFMLWWIDVRVAIPLCFAVGLLLLGTQMQAKKRQQIAVKEAAREREIVEAEMRGRLSEKEILLREIHHRVGNILSNFAANVRTMQRGAKSAETRDTLEHLNARIKVQSAVHMLLQRSDRTDINVANMINQVTAGARDFFGSDDERQIICKLDDVYMTYSKAQYLGLIVNELLTNSYKHGEDDSEHPRAEITLQRDRDGGAEFHYRDFGSGLTANDINAAMETRRYGDSGGLGQVVAMARELKGDPVLYCDNGMHLSFRLPRRLVKDNAEDLVA